MLSERRGVTPGVFFCYNPCMKLSGDEVKHVAQLANLPLSEDEVDQFAVELTQTLEYVEDLKTVDTKGVDPTSQVTGLINVTREDLVTPSLSQEEALSNAKNSYKGFIKVKAVLEID